MTFVQVTLLLLEVAHGMARNTGVETTTGLTAASRATRAPIPRLVHIYLAYTRACGYSTNVVGNGRGRGGMEMGAGI